MSGTRTRRSDEEVVEAIRTAVLDQLAEAGYASVTFEGIARRAGTSKPVLYRRYRSRAQMVLDAIGQSASRQRPPRLTGSLRSDLVAVLTGMARQFTRFSPDVYRGLVGEADDRLVVEGIAALGAVTARALTAAYDDARARGELGPTPIPASVADLPMTVLRHDLMVVQPFDPRSIPGLVDQVFLPLLAATAR